MAAAVVYTVKKGDTLSAIAEKYNTTVSKLAKKNNIKNVNLIFVGQKITISGSTSSANKKKSSNGKKAVIDHFGLQSDSENTIFATWTWSKSNTDKYKVKWTYATGDGVAFIGSESEVTAKQATYNMPANATTVSCIVKPISKKKTVNNKETSYWTADWSTKVTYYAKDNPPPQLSAPSVKLENLKLTASLDNIDPLATWVKFQIVKDNKTVYKSINVTIKTGHASCSCTVEAGSEYKVRAQGARGKIYGDWSDYSNNYGTPPAASEGIHTLKALSETSVQLDWTNVSNAKSYEVQYTTKTMYFDSGGSEVKSVTVDSVVGHAEITGMETGQEYFFRVRAINDNGESPWTEIKSIVLGKDPEPPTTWSSSTTVITGEPLTLYWVHNSVDGSSQTYAELEMYVDNVKETYTIKNTTDEEEKDKTSSYVIDTSPYVEGTKIQWRVRTAGVTKAYGEWSIQRSIDIYAPPTLELSLNNKDDEALDTLTSFPFYVKGLAGPNTQIPIGYHVSITSDEIYETVDRLGNEITVNSGEEVYSSYVDTSDALLVELSASNIDLENNISYTVKVVVTMNSGLTAEAILPFTVSWEDTDYAPNAEIAIDYDTLSASIRPYCDEYLITYYRVEYDEASGIVTVTDEVLEELEGESVEDVYTNDDDFVYKGTKADGTEVYFCMIEATEPTLVENVSLSVYRREYDGTFVELGTGLNNTDNTFVTDPHPSLDFARYRIVAVENATGAVSYTDLAGVPVEESAVVIQWDEAWRSFDTTNEDALEQPAWSGSLLKLPYNIDVSDSNSADVSLIEYIGRSHPVSYYGTHLGISSNWNVEIPKSDKDTLYALRRLARWMGDVYVREPSGSGYWANIKVSYSQKHCETTIPVTLSLTRVEGGV